MKKVIAYLMFWVVTLAGITASIIKNGTPPWLTPFEPAIFSLISGGTGGLVYCLRAVYLNYCVNRRWDERWHVWYFIRPVISTVMGVISFIFLNAGLLVLDSAAPSERPLFGFLAVSFIAGLNVDRFLSRIENLVDNNWGVRSSRTAERSLKDNNDES